MKRLLIVLIALIGLASAYSQSDTTYYADSAYTFNDGGGGNMLIVDVSEPDTVLVTRNSIETDRTYGLAYMVGRDAYDADTGNVNQSIVAGNSLVCSDYDNGVHGGMDGFNLIGWKHNYFANCAYAFVSEGTHTTIHNGDLPIQYNIIKSPGAYGITLQGQKNKQLYNNTFYAGRTMSGYLIHIWYEWPPDAPDTVYATGAELYNNIFYSEVDTVLIAVHDSSQATLECDYNVYWCESSYNNEPSFYVRGNDPEIVNFTQWQALGYDENSVVVDPNFTDTIDFVPQSPLAYGTDLGSDFDEGLSTDYEFVAKSYPNTTDQYGTWEVGAVIYGADGSADYYVSTTGSDDSTGTSVTAAWKTPQKAFETADAGDTVMFLGGSYYPTTYTSGSDIYYYVPGEGYGNSGTYGNEITYMNYPGATPIIDFDSCASGTNYNIGLYMDSVHHVRFIGLTFQNLDTAGTGPTVNVIEGHACSNLYFERIVCRNNGGAAFRYFSGIGDDVGISVDTTKFINCDAFNNADNSKNYADGWKCDQDKGAYFLIEGCRAMFNSDDGFDFSGSAIRVFKNNWSFGNGWYSGGNGNGFKSAALRDTADYTTLIMFNNLSAYNHDVDENGGAGFDLIDYQVSDTSYRRANARLYNNTAYKNDIGYLTFTNPLWSFRNSEFRNNVAYASTYEQDGNAINVQILTYEYPESHNTWDWESGGYSFTETDTVTVTDDDFILTDSTLAVAELMADRGSDGSLPEITFMTLESTSDLIDAGTTNGWSEIEGVPGVGSQVYDGDAPDIGYAELDEVEHCDTINIYFTGSAAYPDTNSTGVGAIDVTVVGGTAPYTYLWDIDSTTQDITGLTTDNYSLTVTDDSTCTGDTVFFVGNVSVEDLAVSLESKTSESQLDSDGTIDITVTGGTSPYTYLWSNTETTQDLTGLSTSVYTCTITDDASDEVTIEVSVNRTYNGNTVYYYIDINTQ